MATGQDLRSAIKSNHRILAVDNCPGVSVALGTALYGRVQNDENEKTAGPASTRTDLANMVSFPGTTSETAVFHFQVDPTHHFVVLPLYDQSGPGWSYSMFMAYENNYTVHEYVQSARGSMGQALARGYRDDWLGSEIVDMLADLLNRDEAWEQHFRHGTRNRVNSITCYKYRPILIDTALANLARY